MGAESWRAELGSSTWGPAILLLPVPYLPEKKLVFLVINEVVVSFMGGPYTIASLFLRIFLLKGKLLENKIHGG